MRNNWKLPSRRTYAFACAMCLSFASGIVQAQGRGAECLIQYQGLQTGVAAPAEAGACRALAAVIVATARDSVVKRALASLADQLAPRDLQSRATTQPSTAGAANQGEAVPTVQPLATAGGSLSAVASGGATDAITAITINPAIFLRPSNDKARNAWLQRMLDLTVLVPIQNLDKNKDGNVDYFGIRGRVNTPNKIDLSAAAQAAAQLAQNSAQSIASLMNLFENTPDLPKCVAEYVRPIWNATAIQSQCGGIADIFLNAQAVEVFRRAVAELREQSDARYFGLDLRLDRGDPTLGATPGASGTTIFAGLAYGRKLSAVRVNESSWGLKLRVGVVQTQRDDKTLADSLRFASSIDGALAFDYTYPSEFQPLKFSGGFEFRRGNVPLAVKEALQTDFVTYRMAVDVPIAGGNSISIALNKPLTGKRKPALSVNANWQLLMSALSQAARE